MDSGITISSWSGGKDSCLACYKAMRQGYKISYLLNFISREFKRCCFHGVEAGLIKLQADLIGIPLVQKEVAADMEEYESDFKSAVSAIKQVKAMVFGDIYLHDHIDWVKRVCSDIDVEPIEPLWQRDPLVVLEDFIDLGFKAVVVSCQADKFDRDFVGKEVDRNLLKELKSRNICPCGENGEFHTLVLDGPIFERRIKIEESAPVLKEGFWKYWFLDIKKFS
jgi:diphthine-ammonia ligase